MSGSAAAAAAGLAVIATLARPGVVASGPGALAAQDVTPPVRHILALDYARVAPFRRDYDIVVLAGDSLVAIGERRVTLDSALLADSSAGWLLTETRTGVVTFADSIVLSSDLRPARWSSHLGRAHVDLAFTSDSASGSIWLTDTQLRVEMAIPPDLVVSGAMLELLAGVLPLGPGWADSVTLLSADASGARLDPATLEAVAEDSACALTAAPPPRPCRELVLRRDGWALRLWVERDSGGVARVAQPLPAHTGASVEYRWRPIAGAPPPE